MVINENKPRQATNGIVRSLKAICWPKNAPFVRFYMNSIMTKLPFLHIMI